MNREHSFNRAALFRDLLRRFDKYNDVMGVRHDIASTESCGTRLADPSRNSWILRAMARLDSKLFGEQPGFSNQPPAANGKSLTVVLDSKSGKQVLCSIPEN